jgi:hypothetical protein
MLSKSRASWKNAEFPTSCGNCQAEVRNPHHLPGPSVGNLRLVLQVRYCSAALIIDEWMQI